MRVIKIVSCRSCPHLDHKGAFGKIAYVPLCRKTNKELPYLVGSSKDLLIATATGIIPESCPLEFN